MLRLIQSAELLDLLREFGATKPMWGICAGAILLAKEVCHPSQSSLALMDIRATRNFYGSQRESFKSQVTVSPFQDPFEVDFIRAPLLEATNPQVELLASHQGQAAMLRQGKLLASSFHIELGQDPRLHEMFVRSK
jgi:5'-phosphate synthase pdxT subunit